MQITKFRVSNYKSFNQPASSIEFTNGINVITGQNNAGKTALLETMSFRFNPNPHRTIKTVPTPGTVYNETTRIDVSFRVLIEELRECLMAFQGGPDLLIAKPQLGSKFAESIGYKSHGQAGVLAKWFLENAHDFNLTLTADIRNRKWTALRIPSFGRYEPEATGGGYSFHKARTLPGLDLGFGFNGEAVQNLETDIGVPLAERFIDRIYVFRAERLNLGSCTFGTHSILTPNAGNLAEVLNRLQNNQARFDRLNHNLRQVLPQIRRVSVRPLEGQSSQVEVVIWPHDPATEREDLVVPLANGGTGIGQVLAILYVVLTSDTPQVIVIDEPQSFLHPGAARKLIEILKRIMPGTPL